MDYQFCKSCNGRMFLDRTTLEDPEIDFVCMMCGRRKYYRRHGGFGEEVMLNERKRRAAYG